MAEVPLLGRILANAVSVVNRASDIAREVAASGQLGIVEKTSAEDLQTRADRSVQDCILASLRKSFPGIAVVGEEGDQTHGEIPDDWVVTDMDADAAALDVPEQYRSVDLQDVCVWVDPLDGTQEFTEGLLDHVTILVGIAVGKTAVAGVMGQPFFNYKDPAAKLGRTLYGMVGGCGGVRGIDCTAASRAAADERVVATSRGLDNQLMNDCVAACNPTQVIHVGGAGHKVLLLLEGLANAYVYPSPGTKKWDTCAPEAILQAAGGRLTDIMGRAYEYDKDVREANEWGILATSTAEEHSGYLALIPDHLKEQVKDN